MEDATKLAFEYSSKTIAELITLSTGIIALTITFGKDLFKNDSRWAKRFLFMAWIVYLLSMCSGIFTLMTLAGALQPKASIITGVQSNATVPGTAPLQARISPGNSTQTSAQPTIWNENTRILAGAQILLFLLGVVFTISYGGFLLWQKDASTPPSTGVPVQPIVTVKVLVEGDTLPRFPR